MATVSISFGSHYNYQELVIPENFSVTVTAPGSVGSGYAVTAVSRQIDDGALVGMTLLDPLPTGPNSVNGFNFQLTTTDCPALDTWYMLTIYAWDNESDCTTGSLTFKRVSSIGP